MALLNAMNANMLGQQHRTKNSHNVILPQWCAHGWDVEPVSHFGDVIVLFRCLFIGMLVNSKFVISIGLCYGPRNVPCRSLTHVWLFNIWQNFELCFVSCMLIFSKGPIRYFTNVNSLISAMHIVFTTAAAAMSNSMICAKLSCCGL